MGYRPRAVNRRLIAVRTRTCGVRFPPAVVLIAARFFPAGRFGYANARANDCVVIGDVPRRSPQAGGRC